MTTAKNKLSLDERMTLTRRILVVCPTLQDLEQLAYLATGKSTQLSGLTLWAKASSLVQWVESQVLTEVLNSALTFCETNTPGGPKDGSPV